MARLEGMASVVDLGDPGALYLARRLLHADRVLVLPTETLYGFSVLAHSGGARQRVQQLKQIPQERPFLGLAASPKLVESLVDSEKCQSALAFLRMIWPAPLTAVLPVRPALPWGEPLDSGGTAAFRVPAHPRLLDLLRGLGQIVLSTSVNRSGSSALRSIEEIQAAFGGEPDVRMFRDSRLERAATEVRAVPASTVADFGTWPPRLLRAGAFDLDAALAAAGGV